MTITDTPAPEAAPVLSIRPRGKRTAVPAVSTSSSTALDTLTGNAATGPLDLPTTALHPHPANPAHRSAEGFEDLAAQIRADGKIRTRLEVRPAPGRPGEYEVLSGSRRLAAALSLGMLMVPVDVLDLDDTGALRRVLADNLNRMDFTPAEEADLVQGLLDLGLSDQALADELGKGKAWIARRRAVAKLTAPARAIVNTRPDVDLVAAAKIAEFDDDPDAIDALTVVLDTKPDQLDHALSRARLARESREVIAAATAKWAAADYTILTTQPWNDPEIKPLVELSAKASGKAITTTEHAQCPGRAVLIDSRRTYGTIEATVAHEVEYCTKWKTSGHFNRHAASSSGSTSGPMDEKAKAERRHLIATNKAAEAAAPVRRAWLEEFFRRDKMPADAIVYAAQILAQGYGELKQNAAWELTGATPKNAYGTHRASWLSHPARALKHLVACAVMSVEQGMPKDYWRKEDGRRDLYGRHLSQLQTWGYPLAPHEQDVVDAWTKAEQKTAKKASR